MPLAIVVRCSTGLTIWRASSQARSSAPATAPAAASQPSSSAPVSVPVKDGDSAKAAKEAGFSCSHDKGGNLADAYFLADHAWNMGLNMIEPA